MKLFFKEYGVYLCLMFLFIVSCISVAHLSNKYEYYPTLKSKIEDTKNIYIQVSNQLGEPAPELIIEQMDVDNAYYDSYTNTITLYTGLIERHNKDEIALVIGHELSHYALHHDESTPINEMLADKLGAFLAMKAGYNMCNGRMIYLNWAKESGDHLDDDHPSHLYRYTQLKLPFCDGERL